MSHRLLRLVIGLNLALGLAASAQEIPGSLDEGRALIRAGDFAAAERLFAGRVEAAPAEGASWFFLGYARHAQGSFESALLAHRKAAGFPRFTARARYNEGCALARLDRKEEALKALEAAVAAGFRDRGQLAADADLELLRAEPRFQGLLPPPLHGAKAFREEVRVLAEIAGEAAEDQFGWVGRPVGDLDLDGVIDFAVTAPTKVIDGSPRGRVYAYSSKSARLIFSRDGEPGDGLGMGVAAAGDVDGDGTPDLVVGATSADQGRGKALVLSGKDGRTLLTLTGKALGDQFGLKVSGAGDVDVDGVPDLAVSAWKADGPLGEDQGRVSLHSGKDGHEILALLGERAGDCFGSALEAHAEGPRRSLAIGAMDGGPGKRGKVYVYDLEGGRATLRFSASAPESGANLGQYFICWAGDVDGDHEGDVFVSDFNDSAGAPSTGRILVLSGKDGHVVLDRAGFCPGENLGTSYSRAGDVDLDGRADFIVGAWQNGEGARSAGRCYLVSGKDGKALATYTSLQEQDTLGFDAVGLGDVDGDGGTDFLLTSAWSDLAGPRSGRIWIIAGPVFPKPTGAPAPSGPAR